MADKDDEKNGEGQVDIGQLTEALKILPEGVQEAVKTAIREASGEQRAVNEAARAAAAAAKDDDDEGEDEEFDVERVSRTELVSHINKGFEKTMSKALKPILDKLEATSTGVETDRVKLEFAKAKGDFPDFMEWKDEMRDIITVHPELSAEDIYLLARAKNPDKVKEVDAKMKKEKGEEEGKDLSERKRAFGGLTPTSGSSVKNDGKKQPKEASTAEWDEVMGSVPDNIIGDALEG